MNKRKRYEIEIGAPFKPLNQAMTFRERMWEEITECAGFILGALLIIGITFGAIMLWVFFITPKGALH